MRMVKALFIPSDLRVVLSGVERRGLEFSLLKTPSPFLPVTSYITATEAH